LDQGKFGETVDIGFGGVSARVGEVACVLQVHEQPQTRLCEEGDDGWVDVENDDDDDGRGARVVW